MNEFARSLADHAPYLTALIVLVVMFLRFLVKQGEAQAARDAKFFEFVSEQNGRFKDLGDACHLVQRESIQAIEKNQERATKAIEENAKAFSRVEKVHEELLRTLHALGAERRSPKAEQQ